MSSCGWCMDGFHDKCVGATRSPQGGLHFCNHPDRSPTLRCVDCSNKTPGEVDPEVWECVGEHRGPHRLRKDARAVASITSKQPDGPATTTPKLTRTGPECACECGGRTKGGKFQPGHDSRYLSQVVETISAGTETLAGALARMASTGLSEALQNKLRKRVTK